MIRDLLTFLRLFVRLGIVALLAAPTLFADEVHLVGTPRLEIHTNQVVLRWSTDQETGTSVLFGPTTERPTRRIKGKVGVNHVVELPGLESGIRYRVILGTARSPLQTNEFVLPSGTSNGATAVTLAVVIPPHLAGLPTVGASNTPPEFLDLPVRSTNTATSLSKLPISGHLSAPPARETWFHPETVHEQFRRHGADFHARDAEDYAEKAWQFRRQAATAGFLAKKDAKGVLRIYDPTSDTYGAYNPDGTTRTFFKPGKAGYFEHQPGKLTKLRD